MPTPTPAAQTFHGKYRGTVTGNVDPEFLGRLLVSVPGAAGTELNWAMPCVPYAGLGVGAYAMPPVGSGVWVEFEGGDLSYPIWTGCFWSEGQTPMSAGAPAIPQNKLFQTDGNTVLLSDLPEVGGITLRSQLPATDVPVAITMTSAGITLTHGANTLQLSEIGLSFNGKLIHTAA